VTTIPHTTPASASPNLAHHLQRRVGRPSRAWVASAWILDVEARQREEDRAIAAAYVTGRQVEDAA
jgi:hypothetical protein